MNYHLKYFLLQLSKILFVCALLVSVNSYGQSYLDVAGVTYSYQQPFGNKEQPGFNTINHVTAFLNAPLKINKDYLLLTPNMEFYDVRIDNKLIPYRSGQFTISWLHQWKNERWNTAFVAITGSNAVKQDWFKQNALQAGGAILNTFTKNKDLKFKFGVYGNAEFFGPYFLPLLGIDWNITSRLGLYGILPSYLFLEYKIIPDKFHGKLFVDAETISYRNKSRQFFRVNDNHIKMISDFYLTKQIVLSAEAGHSFLRDFKGGERKDGKTTQYNLDYHDDYLVRMGLYFRVSTESKN